MLRRLIPAMLVVAALHAADLSAQDWKGRGRLEGKLTTKDGKPLADADVKLRLSRAKAQGTDLKTDKSGRWSYLGLAGGEWSVEFNAPGFIPGKVIVTVSEVARQPIINYSLDPVPPTIMMSVWPR